MDERYVVAPGVTIEVSATGDEYIAGDFISPADFPTIAEFKGFLAAGRIIRYAPPEEPPAPRREWDYFSIDEAPDVDSPNPVSNRALCAAESLAAERLENERLMRAETDSSLEARIAAEEERAREAEGLLSGSAGSISGRLDSLEAALSARIDGAASAIDAERERALSAETDTANKLALEESARQSRDDALSSGLSAENDRARRAESRLAEDLETESSARAAGVAAEENRARAAETRNERAIESEKTTRQLETSSLRQDIGTLVGDDEGMSAREIARDAMGTVYHPCGSRAFSELPPLSSAKPGDVWNVTDGFVTTDDFVEGAGKEIPAGANVVAVDTAAPAENTEDAEDTEDAENTENTENTENAENTEEPEEPEEPAHVPVLKWDILGGVVDLSAYQTKQLQKSVQGETTVEGALAALAGKIEELGLGIWNSVKEKIASVLGLSEKSACLATVEGSIVEEWTENDFAGSAGTQFGGGSATTRGTTHGLYVDASAAGAKWYERTDTPWSLQVNAGVKVYVPATAMQKNRRLSVGLYEGTEIETDTEIQTVNGGTYVSFTVVKSGYIRRITYMHDSDSQIKADASGVRVLRDLSVGGSITSRGKNAVLSVNGTAADASGNVTISVSGVPSDYDALKSRVSELEKKVATLMQRNVYDFYIE